MKVIKWVNYSDKNYDDADLFFPGAYNDALWVQMEEAIINELREKGYKFSGYYHQNGEFGVPIVEHDTRQCKATFSLRGWGRLMANALNITDSMAYVIWAWNNPEPEVLPEKKED